MDLATGIEELHRRGEGNPLETLKVELNRDDKTLRLHYEPVSPGAFFDVFDAHGNVLHSQRFTSEVKAEWSFETSPPDEYQFFLVSASLAE